MQSRPRLYYQPQRERRANKCALREHKGEEMYYLLHTHACDRSEVHAVVTARVQMQAVVTARVQMQSRKHYSHITHTYIYTYMYIHIYIYISVQTHIYIYSYIIHPYI